MAPTRDKAEKKRLDVLIVERGLAESRERAQALIIAGNVLCGDVVISKPGTKLAEDSPLRLRGAPDRYVSRGAHKLLGAIVAFHLDLTGKTCLDIGASTGGFTQVCLEAGARKVYAIDVGTNQLHWSLRSDPRVVSIEGVNVRTAQPGLIPERADFACIDTSFISLRLILPAVLGLLNGGAPVVALIKPQFEVGKDDVGKGGLVKDPALHERVTAEISSFAQSIGFTLLGLIESPLKGTTGNLEFLMHLRAPA